MTIVTTLLYHEAPFIANWLHLTFKFSKINTNNPPPHLLLQN